MKTYYVTRGDSDSQWLLATTREEAFVSKSYDKAKAVFDAEVAYIKGLCGNDGYLHNYASYSDPDDRNVVICLWGTDDEAKTADDRWFTLEHIEIQDVG